MAAKKYSAGAIFLQVVPVFANVQRAIEDEAKNIDRALGDQMEKSGEKAGERAGRAASKSMQDELKRGGIDRVMEGQILDAVDGMNKALGKLDTSKLGKKMRAEIKDMRRDLEGMSDIDLKVDDNFDKVAAKVDHVDQKIREMQKRSKVFLGLEGLPQLYRDLAKAQAAIKGIDGTVKLDVDSKGAERAIGSFERNVKSSMAKASRSIAGTNKELDRLKSELEYLGKLRVGIDISASQLHREVGEIQAELEKLSQSDPEIDVRLDSGRASAELKKWMAEVAVADHQNIDVDVDVDTDRASRKLGLLANSGETAANTFRSFNGVLFAAVAAGPALIPILAGIAGGLLALGPAAAVAGAGLGSVLIGFSGIGDAVSALKAQEQQAGITAQTAANREVSSARAVADARRSAARAVESALDQQKAAQERYADSIQDVKDAEQALRQAREAAKGTGADIREQISDNKLAQDQGLLDVFNATVAYDSTMADGSATNAEQEQARINLEQAKDRLSDLRKEAKELAKEQKKWRQEGVNGTDEVQNAQDRLNDALDAQKDAYQALGDASEAVDQARADGARQVSDALRDQANAMDQLTSQQNKVNEAFEALGPAGQQFALFLYGLQDDFQDFRNDIQTVLLPAVQEAMEAFMGSESGAVLRDLMIDLARGFGQFVKALSQSFQGPVWLEFFQTLHDLGPDIQAAYGRAFISFLEAMASILTTLAPFALDFANGLAKMADGFARWADSEKGQAQIERFLAYVEEIGPEVLDFFGALAGALGAILIALAPYAENTLQMLTSVFDYIAGMDKDILAPLAAGVLAILTGSQAAYGVVSTLIAAGTLIGSTFGIIIFAIIGIALGVAYLMKTNEDFRDFMVDAWEKISDAISGAWEDYLKPALADLWDAVKDLWDQVLEPFFEWLGPILVKFAQFYFPMLLRWWGIIARGIAWLIREVLIPVFRAIGPVLKWLIEKVIVPFVKEVAKGFRDMATGVRWAWNNILHPVWNAIATAAKWLWKNVLVPVFDDIGESWDDLMTAMKWVWNHILKPVFDFIANDALPGLEGAFRTTVNAIERIWDGLKRVVGAPIKFVLDTIINKGLIAGMNKVAGWVGMDDDTFKEVSIPKALQSYATGGVMPGYTPGRDVHRFVSPTAGMLELSGGEAVMRPEFTAAVGPDYVNQMNALARSRGVSGVRKALGMGSYWLGGVLPVPGAHTSSHGSMYGHPAYDINYGSGYDDYGRPIGAWKAGVVAQKNYIGDASYGRWVVLNHPGNQSSLYAHMSRFADIAVGQAVRAGQTIGYVGDLGNTGNPPTSHLHFEIMGGNVDFGDSSTGGSGPDHPSLPGYIKGLLKSPIDTIKGWMTDKWSAASSFVNDSPAFDVVKRVPLELANGVKDKVMGIIPGWAKAAAGVAGKVGDTLGDIGSGIASGAGAVGDALGLHTGGILPYNGTMMYDNGGYLPPGMTTVVNLTGKPEPVFTNDQWAGMEGGAGGSIHYEPHFDGSDLGPEDVAADLNFTFRRIKRGGKYEGVGS